MSHTTHRFVPVQSHRITPPAGAATRANDFSVFTSIDGQNLQIELSWNGYFGYYAARILRSDSSLIRAWYPRLDQPLLVRNFNLEEYSTSDARLTFVDDRGGYDTRLDEVRVIERGAIGIYQHLDIELGRVQEMEETQR